MENIEEILSEYRVQSMEYAKVTERLYWVRDRQKEYALKRSSLREGDAAVWANVFYVANEKNISEILPVYLTADSQLYTNRDGTLYYLVPWMKATGRSSLKYKVGNGMKTLGNIHHKTKKEVTLTKEKLQKNFHTYLSYSKQARNELYSYVLQFERKIYMSPFELLVCTHFREMEHAIQLNFRKLSEFLEQEDELVWSNCLCHGTPSTDHFIDGYLINWEHARFDHAVTDLAAYFGSLTGSYDQPAELIMESFSIYQNRNNLTQQELMLLTIYLLNPSAYLGIIRSYIKNPSEESLMHQTRKLQQAYRKLLFGLRWEEFIRKEYETVYFEE